MPNLFFRSDDRVLADLVHKGFAGFEAWVQLELPDIRKVVTRFNGVYTAPILLKEKRAQWLSDAVFKYNRKTLNMASLGQLIKSKVDESSIQISTDLTPEGGGRAKKHMFQITIPKTLYLIDPRTGAYQQNPASFKVIVGAKLVMDALKVENATIIGISIIGNEVAFLTRLPREWITQLS